MADYKHREIEKHWREDWASKEIYKATEDTSKPKYYVLDMFPYPSGAGLHVGHPLGYIASDIVARYKRLNGFNVLHPMGFDAFGLPAEQYAIQTGQHPADTTRENIIRYKEQLNNIGFSFDWSREVQTSDPKFYKWTQWIFTQLFNHWYDKEAKKARPISELTALFEAEGNTKVNAANNETTTFTADEWKLMNEQEQQGILLNYRLTYIAEATVNWCEALGTVLANDEVKDGVSERGGYPVVQRKMKQWFLRITAYADRLLEGLDRIDWTDALKEMQRNWIGKSEGSSIKFTIENTGDCIEVFSTRPDTIYGATFMVLAPEHELVEKITHPEFKAGVDAYIEKTKNRSERERMMEKEISGVPTGAFAINPFTHEEIPIWIADYVLAGYGTGAVMAVPAHDSRDFAFAKHFGLPIRQVVSADGKEQELEESYDAKEGILINSDDFNGLAVKKAIKAAIYAIEKRGIGEGKTNFRLRDAGFSRQRYWGEPFPIIYKQGLPYVVDESELPVELPKVTSYKPTGTGDGPLAALTDWVNTPDGERETNTMPGYAGSSWYFLRYMDPHNEKEFAAKEKIDYWQNVDLYIGGSEHATGHLLYARFWNKFLFDLGLIAKDEPFEKLINQGMILGENNEKMSKSKGNVVNPDDIIEQYGADTLRLYEMFLGPLEQSKPWDTNGIEGVYRFIGKLWRLFHSHNGEFYLSDEEPTKEEYKSLHKTIKKAQEDIENFSFNTSVSSFMICVNELSTQKCFKRKVLQDLLIILSPYIPHVTEELWHKAGNTTSIVNASFPQYKEEYLVENSHKYPVSINGKTRTTIELALDLTKEDIEKAVMQDEVVQKWIEGKTPKKVIVVPGRIVNLVL